MKSNKLIESIEQNSKVDSVNKFYIYETKNSQHTYYFINKNDKFIRVNGKILWNSIDSIILEFMKDKNSEEDNQIKLKDQDIVTSFEEQTIKIDLAEYLI